MSRNRALIIALTFGLIASNLWWLYAAYDAVVTATYQEVVQREHKEALEQALAVIPVLGNSDSTKAEILNAAKHPYLNTAPFEKDGYIWIGRLGFAFNEKGRVSKVVTTWE